MGIESFEMVLKKKGDFYYKYVVKSLYYYLIKKP